MLNNLLKYEVAVETSKMAQKQQLEREAGFVKLQAKNRIKKYLANIDAAMACPKPYPMGNHQINTGSIRK